MLTGEDIFAGWHEFSLSTGGVSTTASVGATAVSIPAAACSCPLCGMDTPTYLRLAFLAPTTTSASPVAWSSEPSQSSEVEWYITPLYSPAEVDACLRTLFSASLSPFAVAPSVIWSLTDPSGIKSTSPITDSIVASGLGVLHAHPTLFFSSVFHSAVQQQSARWLAGPLLRYSSLHCPAPVFGSPASVSAGPNSLLQAVDNLSPALIHAVSSMCLSFVPTELSVGGDSSSSADQDTPSLESAIAVVRQAHAETVTGDTYERSILKDRPWMLRLRPLCLITHLALQTRNISALDEEPDPLQEEAEEAGHRPVSPVVDQQRAQRDLEQTRLIKALRILVPHYVSAD